MFTPNPVHNINSYYTVIPELDETGDACTVGNEFVTPTPHVYGKQVPPPHPHFKFVIYFTIEFPNKQVVIKIIKQPTVIIF